MPNKPREPREPSKGKVLRFPIPTLPLGISVDDAQLFSLAKTIAILLRMIAEEGLKGTQGYIDLTRHIAETSQLPPMTIRAGVDHVFASVEEFNAHSVEQLEQARRYFHAASATVDLLEQGPNGLREALRRVWEPFVDFDGE